MSADQPDYCLQYETHEPVKKDKESKSARSVISVSQAESSAELNQKILSLVELMIDEQLGTSNPSAQTKEKLLRQEIDTGVKGSTCRQLIKLLNDTILKYLDDHRIDGLAQLPSTSLVDILALLASILEDHQHALVEGMIKPSSGDSNSSHCWE